MEKRILFITSAMCKGGAETQLVKLALFLRSLNYKVLIISLKPINEFDIDYEKEGIPVLFLKNWKQNLLGNNKTIYNTIKNFKPDTVIAFMFIAIIFARIFKKLLKYRLISSIRISVINKKWYLPFRLTSGLDDEIVYNSSASKKNFESKGLVNKIGVVINNSIPVPISENNTRNRLPKGKFVWICIAHFRWNKDYTTLFKAIALLRDVNFRVDIIGEFNASNNPARLINELQIQDHVNVLGFKQNPSFYLEYADAFVLSSFSEGMPNALLEAMAYCKPVVATDIDCNQEIIQSAGCGFLSKKQNENDLADKMLKMMTLTALERNNLGKKGQNYIKENFAEEGVMNSWINLIHHNSQSQELSTA